VQRAGCSVTAGYIYIIDPGIEVNGRPVVKIGRTTRSPHKRLRELQTALPQKAALVHFARFPNVAVAEKHLHTVLARFHVQDGGGSEFFFLTPANAIALINGLAHQISACEAKRALEHDLENFLERVSGKLALKIAKVTALGAFVALLAYYVNFHDSLTAAVVESVVGWLMSVFFLTIPAYCVGDALAKLIWRREIEAERTRLISERYPAAADNY
jgi:VIT1/CCC1 family predicted Fe2+/Mn2+ transporter